MSFRLFIYYCALCGAWAALFVWLLVTLTGLAGEASDKWVIIRHSTMIGAVLGLFLAAVVGLLDALLNSVGFQRVLRPLVAMTVGLIGGMFGAFIGEALHRFTKLPKFPGWVLAGTAIGISIGIFDVGRAVLAGSGFGMAARKVLNGAIGGFLGGLVGGVVFDLLTAEAFVNLLASRSVREEGGELITEVTEGIVLTRSSLAVGLVILGACIGLLIGAAQVILKEAWVRVEAGFRAGREMMLSKAETTVGRAESCDIGLFGDSAIERLHARIVQRNNRYFLDDADTPGGTYLNGQRISGPTPLRSGDRIGIGRAVLRFGERAKR
jgi:hypothetical protein